MPPYPIPQWIGPAKPVPERIAAVLSVVAILTEYGRHLADTIEHRAIWRGFATIAQFFGTAAMPVILAHIRRGIMRAVALEHMLLRRAARGRDLAILARRVHARRAAEPTAPPAEPATTAAAAPPPAEAPPAQQPASRPARRTGPEEPLTLDTLPSMAQLEAEVRRRPIGRTIVDICRDLGISPSLCDGPFWNRVFMAIHCYRGSLGNIVAGNATAGEAVRQGTLEAPESGTAGANPRRGPARAGLFHRRAAGRSVPSGAGTGRARLRCSAERAGRGSCDRAALNAAHTVSEPDARGRSMAGPAAPIRAAATVMARPAAAPYRASFRRNRATRGQARNLEPQMHTDGPEPGGFVHSRNPTTELEQPCRCDGHRPIRVHPRASAVPNFLLAFSRAAHPAARVPDHTAQASSPCTSTSPKVRGRHANSRDQGSSMASAKSHAVHHFLSLYETRRP